MILWYWHWYSWFSVPFRSISVCPLFYYSSDKCELCVWRVGLYSFSYLLIHAWASSLICPNSEFDDERKTRNQIQVCISFSWLRYIWRSCADLVLLVNDLLPARITNTTSWYYLWGLAVAGPADKRYSNSRELRALLPQPVVNQLLIFVKWMCSSWTYRYNSLNE